VFGVLVLAFLLAALLFDPEQRFFPHRSAGGAGWSGSAR
jgi:hypothetical protein